MRLSEAILLGSTASEQCFSLLSVEWESGKLATCALGSAALALGKLRYGTVGETYPWVFETELLCPASERYRCEDIRMTVEGLIQHLNDSHRWTRERIAEWVATIEPKELPADSGERPQSFVDESVLKV